MIETTKSPVLFSLDDFIKLPITVGNGISQTHADCKKKTQLGLFMPTQVDKKKS